MEAVVYRVRIITQGPTRLPGLDELRTAIIGAVSKVNDEAGTYGPALAGIEIEVTRERQ